MGQNTSDMNMQNGLSAFAARLFRKVIEPALQPFFANEFKTSVAEITVQNSNE